MSHSGRIRQTLPSIPRDEEETDGNFEELAESLTEMLS